MARTSPSASPRRPVSSAWPVPTATTRTSMPVACLKAGSNCLNRPDCSVEVVDATTQEAAQALAHLRALGADHAEVRIDHGHSLAATVRDGALEQLSEAQSLGLALRVVVGGRVAAVTTSDLRADALAVMLARAVELAQLAEEDPLAEPPPPRALAKRWPEL